MFVDFNKVFKSKPQEQTTIPPAMIPYLNKSLPEGTKYIIDKSGNCVVTSENGSFSIGGVVFKPTNAQKKILGKNYTHNDALAYFYNAQKPIPLELETDGFITLNGEKFPIERLEYNPLHPLKFVSGSVYMYPSPFPNPFSVMVGDGKYERELYVSRVPNESVSILAFESSQNAPLFIKYFLDNFKSSLTMSMLLNLKYAKSIRDIVESTMIYNAFLDGKGYFSGHLLTTKLREDEAKRFDDNSARFWEKVLEIETYLEVVFVPPQEDVSFDTMCLVEQLYQNLIKKVPTRDAQRIDSIDGCWDFEKKNKDIENSLGKPIFFEFEATTQVDLFGAKKKLPTLIGIFNAVLSGHSEKGGKQKLVLTDESTEKQRYTAMLCFKTESDLNAYKKIDHSEIISRFHDAKRPSEYLQ